ncbi:hypothetical protein Osc1_14600 [Hominimerdicola sp. 21CYCFAH17_S]
MKRICIFYLSLYMLFPLTSCGTSKGGDSHTSKPFVLNSESISSTTEYVTSVLNFDNLCTTIVCNYPGSQNEFYFFILCVLSDGDIWATTYSLNAEGSDENNFFYKLYKCDVSVWTLCSEPYYLGQLKLNDVEMLTEYISKIDLASEYYSREKDDMGLAPEVKDSAFYTIYCYVPDEDGEKSSFHVKSYGNNTGCSYETKDVNAVSVLQMIQNSEFYKTWLEAHTK